jgi:hypothetical protein
MNQTNSYTGNKCSSESVPRSAPASAGSTSTVIPSVNQHRAAGVRAQIEIHRQQRA